MNPYEYVKSINQTKENIMVDDESEKGYNSYIVNRSLSYFNDTVMFANEMNVNHQLDNRLKYEFLLGTIRKKARFSKWIKPDTEESLNIIKECYGYSNEKALQVLNLLSVEQIGQIKRRLSKGGRTP
jgi:hypothetical protein